MIVVICPGIHSPELTHQFVAALAQANIALSPGESAGSQTALELWGVPSSVAPYAPDLILRYLTERWRSSHLPPNAPTAWIGFSAGVVGAVAAARQWQRQGGKVQGLIAVDGWGVPLGHRFPRFRLGHDRFTAQSCEWLGRSEGFFYCEPAVDHLALWRSPQQSVGYWQPHPQSSFQLDLGPLAVNQVIPADQLLAQLLVELAHQP